MPQSSLVTLNFSTPSKAFQKTAAKTPILSQKLPFKGALMWFNAKKRNEYWFYFHSWAIT